MLIFLSKVGGMYIPTYRFELLQAPSLVSDTCCACGAMATNRHHVVPGARRATKDLPESPTVPLCGSGTTGCHGLAHAHRLHFRYRDGWEFLRTDEPVGDFAALEMEGWSRCSR